MEFSWNDIPWAIRAGIPLFQIIGLIGYFHYIFNFNFMEFLGVTFCIFSSFYMIANVYRFVYRTWIGVWLGHNTDLTKLGSWAVVTGATDGIGKAYANALAKRGINIVLISRSFDKLTTVANEIRHEHQVEIKIITVDFTGCKEIYDEIEEELRGMEIGVLVNNVGMAYPFPEYFLDLPKGRHFYQDLINCNIQSVVMMTSIVLPGMLERKKGAVINLGSISCKLDVPFMTLYGASKAFVDKFTHDLELEYRDQGIIFQSLIPGYVVSNMSKVKKSTLFVPTAEDFVDGALKVIGLKRRTTAWLPHDFLHLSIHFGQFFRREGAAEVSELLAKEYYMYGKKVMMYRSKAG